MSDSQKSFEEELLKLMQTEKSNQEKFNSIQALAKKYNVPLEKMLKNIIMEWVNNDKEKKFNTMPKKDQNKRKP
ncbi:MAG: hypothetical protein ACLFP1_04270 [Candidatus Goldiibacteriota bacterium]